MCDCCTFRYTSLPVTAQGSDTWTSSLKGLVWQCVLVVVLVRWHWAGTLSVMLVFSVELCGVGDIYQSQGSLLLKFFQVIIYSYLHSHSKL